MTLSRSLDNGVRRCTNSRQVAREPTEPLPRQKCALDIPDGTSSTAFLTSFDLLKGNFRPKRLGNVAQRQRADTNRGLYRSFGKSFQLEKHEYLAIKKELIERCVPDRVILTVGNVHLNHVNECYCSVTKAQLCGAPPTE